MTNQALAMARLISILSFLSATEGFSVFNEKNLPLNLSPTCRGALINDINCEQVITSFTATEFYSPAVLDKACTSSCSSSWASLRSSTASSCGNQTWDGLGSDSPIALIPELMSFSYNVVCLKDAGRYCNNVIAANAAATDQTGMEETHSINVLMANMLCVIVSLPPGVSPLAYANGCDLCAIKKLGLEAGSPYYNGPVLLDQSVYQSKTSSCSLSGYPLTTTSIYFEM
jgi:hypothetical protein